MKKCPSCNRAYSDAVKQCPSCGIELKEGYSTSNASNSQDDNNVETHTQKVVDTGEEKKENGAGGWKKSAAVLLMLVLLFACLYATKLSDYNDLVRKYNKRDREYDTLNAEYNELENVLNQYDLEGKYTIKVTEIYNGTDEYEKISDELSRENMDCLCIKWSIYDYTKSWGDVLYADMITPDGKVFLPKAANNQHTWKTDLSDTVGEVRWLQGWLREGIWKSGTYRIIFYQGSRAIDSFEVKVT